MRSRERLHALGARCARGIGLAQVGVVVGCVDGVTPDCSDAAAQCGPTRCARRASPTAQTLPRDARTADARADATTRDADATPSRRRRRGLTMRVVLAALALAGRWLLARACGETRRPIGEECLRGDDCLSGVCSARTCVAAPPLVTGAGGAAARRDAAHSRSSTPAAPTDAPSEGG